MHDACMHARACSTHAHKHKTKLHNQAHVRAPTWGGASLHTPHQRRDTQKGVDTQQSTRQSACKQPISHVPAPLPCTTYGPVECRPRREGRNEVEFPRCFRTLVVKIEKTNSNSTRDFSKRINFTRVDLFFWSKNRLGCS